MLMIIFLCFMKILEQGILNGELTGVVISNSEEQDSVHPTHLPNVTYGYLPPQEFELRNDKHNKVLRKRSTGRQMILPTDAVERMRSVPFSQLSPTIEENKKTILSVHNELRSNANPSASNMLLMEWSKEAEAKAQEWANQCQQGHSTPSFRRLKDDCGCSENLFLAPVKVDWKVVITTWHNECQDFKYKYGSTNGMETGHYTLLMWAAVSKVGCGCAECPNLPNTYNFVCVYCPRGNKPPMNTPYIEGPPCSSCPNSCSGKLCTNPCPVENFYSDCKDSTSDKCSVDPSLPKDCPAVCQCVKGEIRD